MRCEVCGSEKIIGNVSGFSICEKCYGRLELLKKGNGTILDYYRREENLNQASPVAREFLEKLIAGKTEERNMQEGETNIWFKERRQKEAFCCTSGYNFEGFTITKYLGIEMAETIFWGSAEPEKFVNELQEARKNAMEKLISNCISKNANAIIGVKMDVLRVADNNSARIVCVSGTAVSIE